VSSISATHTRAHMSNSKWVVRGVVFHFVLAVCHSLCFAFAFLLCCYYTHTHLHAHGYVLLSCAGIPLFTRDTLKYLLEIS